MINLIIGFVVGFVVCYFVMRNNPKYIKIEDILQGKRDDIIEKLKEKLKS